MILGIHLQKDWDNATLSGNDTVSASIFTTYLILILPTHTALRLRVLISQHEVQGISVNPQLKKSFTKLHET